MSQRGGRLPTATVAFPWPPVITGGPGASLLGFFFVFFSPSTGNLGAVRLPGASVSDHLTELVCFLKAKRHSGLEFLQQRQSTLCFSSCCGRLGSLGSSLGAPRNNRNDCETRSLLMPRHKSKSSCEVFDHPGLIPSS